MRITATEFKAAIDLLEKFRTDYQFNKEDEGYLGFLNVGSHILDESVQAAWFLICTRAQIFMPIIHEIGDETKQGLNFKDTIFILAHC